MNISHMGSAGSRLDRQHVMLGVIYVVICTLRLGDDRVPVCLQPLRASEDLKDLHSSFSGTLL